LIFFLFKLLLKRNGESIKLGVREVDKSSKQDSPLMVETISVIHVTILRGDGSDNNPMRRVEQYWSLDGDFLVEKDPIGL